MREEEEEEEEAPGCCCCCCLESSTIAAYLQSQILHDQWVFHVKPILVLDSQQFSIAARQRQLHQSGAGGP